MIAFVQAQSGHAQARLEQPEVSSAVEAGKPPPPPTWEGADYEGKGKQATGIIEILEMIHEDILKDQRKAKAEEKDSEQLYLKAKQSFQQQEGELEAIIPAAGGRKGEKQRAVGDEKSTRRGTKNELDAVVDKIQKAEPGCDFIAVNYALRASNRQIEIDGLIKAKAILQGAVFSVVDAGRELTPGDALFLQRRPRPGQ